MLMNNSNLTKVATNVVEYENNPTIMCLGDIVLTKSNRPGIVRYISDKSKKMKWIGLELTEPVQLTADIKNLFKCKHDKHGILVPLNQIHRKIMPQELLWELSDVKLEVVECEKKIAQLQAKLIANENNYAKFFADQLLNDSTILHVNPEVKEYPSPQPPPAPSSVSLFSPRRNSQRKKNATKKFVFHFCTDLYACTYLYILLINNVFTQLCLQKRICATLHIH